MVERKRKTEDERLIEMAKQLRKMAGMAYAEGFEDRAKELRSAVECLDSAIGSYGPEDPE